MIILNVKTKAERGLFFSFLIIVVLGTLFHFVFDFSGGNTIVGSFTPVNESIWEHLKLILFPSLIAGFLEYFTFGKELDGYFAAKAYGTLIGMVFLLTAYYTYVGIVGSDSAIFNIALFIASAAVTSIATYLLLFVPRKPLNEHDSIIGILILTFLVIIFIYFTFNPPMLELFRDPLSEDFGIPSIYIN